MGTQADYSWQGLATFSGVRPRPDARTHASRSTLSWALAQLLDPSPISALDLEVLRAVLDLATPSDELAPAWNDVRRAVSSCDAQDFAVIAGSSCAADLRSLARLSDRASLALVGADSAEHEHVLRLHAAFLAERGPRLELIANELRKARSSPHTELGRALDRILQELGSTVGWHCARREIGAKTAGTSNAEALDPDALDPDALDADALDGDALDVDALDADARGGG